LSNTTINKTLFIINPKAGNGKPDELVKELKPAIAKYNIKGEFVFTANQGDAKLLTQKSIKSGIRHFVVVGGDGTLNEVVNGMFQQKEISTSGFYLGILPRGTGNDWSRYYKMPHNIDEAMKIIAGNYSITQDIGKIEFYNHAIKNEAYFINIAGFAFDAAVVLATNQMQERGKRQKSAYLFNLLKCMFQHKNMHMDILVNEQKISDNIFSISIGNGKYSGGGMVQTPNAVINDGILDVTVYLNLKKIAIIKNVSKLYNNKILEVKGVRSYKTDNLTIKTPSISIAEIDGEIIEGNIFNISVISNSLNILVPQE
jgi:YegS/Rv2252/BmrU family lipid kinase